MKFTDKVFEYEFKGYKDKHEFADSKTTGDWILWMDADERATPELRTEIESLKKRAELPDGFEMPRRTWFAGRWIKHSGWYPDYQMRLYRKDGSYWDGVAPHETARVNGKIERLSGHILHYTKKDLSEYHRTIDSYTSAIHRDAIARDESTHQRSLFGGGDAHGAFDFFSAERFLNVGNRAHRGLQFRPDPDFVLPGVQRACEIKSVVGRDPAVGGTIAIADFVEVGERFLNSSFGNGNAAVPML
jgi:hypothetical protein